LIRWRCYTFSRKCLGIVETTTKVSRRRCSIAGDLPELFIVGDLSIRTNLRDGVKSGLFLICEIRKPRIFLHTIVPIEDEAVLRIWIGTNSQGYKGLLVAPENSNYS